jgi:putative ABC transport system ATP-binding protein
MIDVVEVSKVYGKKEHTFTALHEVTFQIPDGTSVAIVGKSGSGKSTLMHIMSGLDHPSKGAVIIGGDDISALKSKALDRFRAEKIGFIFQAFFVQANESCYHNVALPLEIADVRGDARKKRIHDALKQVDLGDKIYQKAKNLSGGQKQRLAIARAIVNRPKIIFADEPTGNLDSATGEMIEDLLFGFNKKLGTTLVIVTHDAELAAKCDMQIFMKDGAVVRTVKSSANIQKGAKS